MADKTHHATRIDAAASVIDDCMWLAKSDHPRAPRTAHQLASRIFDAVDEVIPVVARSTYEEIRTLLNQECDRREQAEAKLAMCQEAGAELARQRDAAQAQVQVLSDKILALRAEIDHLR